MSELTDEETKKGLAALDKLADDTDQLAAEVKDCKLIHSSIGRLFELGWWFIEEAIADETGTLTCGHFAPKIGEKSKPYCCTCDHYNELRQRAESIRGRL